MFGDTFDGISSDEGLGVQREFEECQALAAQLGWEVVAHFDDNDLSAYSGKIRPGFEALLQAIEAGEIDAVICWHPDRLYRSMKDLERIIEVTDRHTVQLRTVNGGDLDLSSATGRMMARILGSVSRQESEHKGERQRAAAIQKAKAGKPQWAHAFGYRNVDGVIEMDPITGPLVGQAYDDLIAGLSLGDIMRKLNSAGAYGERRRKHRDPDTGEVTIEVVRTAWTQTTVSLFLRKPRNAGIREYNNKILRDDNGQPVMGTWPPLVELSVWETAQSILSDPKRAPGRKSVQRHLLTGILVCGKCSATLSGGHASTKQIVYGCKKCRGVSIRAKDVEDRLYEIVAVRMSEDDAVELLTDKEADEQERRDINAQLSALYKRKKAVPRMVAKGILDEDEAEETQRIIREEVAELIGRRDRATAPHVLDGAPLGEEPAVEEAWLREQTPDRFRAIITSLSTVTIKPCGKAGYLYHPETKQKMVDPKRVYVDWR